MRDLISLRLNRNKERIEKRNSLNPMSIVELGMFPGSIFGYTKESVPLLTIVHRVKRPGSILIEKRYPCLIVSSPNSKFTVIFFHGNGESLLSVYWMAKEACRVYPIRIICPEYKGYGIRPGIQTERDAYEMASACFRFCYKKWKEPIIVSGYSIGTGMTAYLAKKYESMIKLVVMIAGYTSIKAVVRYRFRSKVISNIIRERFPNHERLKTFKGNIVFIHGTDDTTIPIEHSKLMYSDCPSKHKYFVEIPESHVFSEWNDYIFKPIISILLQQ